jgi:hypothetical protein
MTRIPQRTFLRAVFHITFIAGSIFAQNVIDVVVIRLLFFSDSCT